MAFKTIATTINTALGTTAQAITIPIDTNDLSQTSDRTEFAATGVQGARLVRHVCMVTGNNSNYVLFRWLSATDQVAVLLTVPMQSA
jgi:hypothetical protein